MVANYLRLDDPALAPDAVFAAGAAEAARTITALSTRAGGLRGRIVRFALGRARALAACGSCPSSSWSRPSPRCAPSCGPSAPS
nr:hypothetical protein GCM10020093_100360 [Planobispora longispora]